MGKKIDLTGQVFGRLTVIKDSGIRDSSGRVIWECLCSCGTSRNIQGCNLTRGDTKSCGCLQRESTTKHGLYNHPLYNTYTHMMSRCYNIDNSDFASYGGRGIKVCSRWLDSITNFIEDMGEKPEGYSINRIDNDGDYEPNNCEWQTSIGQCNNRRSSKYITYNNETHTLAEWSKKTNINSATINSRLKLGWTIEKALFTKTPVDNYFQLRGETKTLPEWSKSVGIKIDTIRGRLRRGWSIEQALTTPVGAKKCQ